jgi:mRNA-degrading endonuclease toxin of MazEF toxin-antitoxin module
VTVGDLYWVELPARGGRAQAGRRPAIILQTASGLPTTVIVPLTSQLDALRFPGTILMEPDAENGLRRRSVALVFQLTAVDNRYITERLGVVTEHALEEIFFALDQLTGRR